MGYFNETNLKTVKHYGLEIYEYINELFRSAPIAGNPFKLVLDSLLIVKKEYWAGIAYTLQWSKK